MIRFYRKIQIMVIIISLKNDIFQTIKHSIQVSEKVF
mgnify:CR=1 FL=1